MAGNIGIQGFAAGGGNDALESVFKRYLLQQELQQRAEQAAAQERDRAAYRSFQERQLQGQESDRAAARDLTARTIARQEAADTERAAGVQRDDMRARINMIPQGSMLSADQAAEFQKASPELFEADQGPTSAPDFMGPLEAKPTGQIRFRGTAAQMEKDAARKAAEEAQARQFAQQKEIVALQGRNAITAAAAGRQPAIDKAADAAAAQKTQQANEINDALDLIGSIEADPALQHSVGPFDARRPSLLSTDPGGIERFRASQDRLVGILQLAAAGKLKGQGQVSNNERQLLAKAATSLNQYGNEADYRKELGRIRQYFERAAQQQGGGMPVINPASAHKPMSADDLLKKYGG